MEPSPDFVITSTISYRPYRIPPRCRKPRPVEETFTHEFRIPCVSSEDAPIVAWVPDDHGYLGAPAGEDAPLRAHNGQLYAAQARDGRSTKAGSGAFPATRHYESRDSWDSQAIREAGKQFENILIIDGEVWKTAKEPAYAIVTLGMGENHGGTYLEIDYAGRYARQFPLTDYEAAVEAAVAFAQKRKDTGSIPIIRKTPKATILDPSVFTTPSAAERQATAETEIRTLVGKARNVLSGQLTRMSLREVKDLMDEVSELMSQAGVDEVHAPPTQA
ncbi:hypothetical protein [Pseudarthrobacter sp. BIM B-2242]|uniref:hypothetical protein n=1 Tax=Pseudarthrobacter sp. BIM B-2242 TaxID=2772401 RepID=UPI00168B3BB8|nr:hypothetical protein [Pseudarthrobacter sp. BIM B-2242]QOD05958.1 hypothetical protein IDT60_20530 [Pseudarthrobacter sp. BIM B-2242]